MNFGISAFKSSRTFAFALSLTSLAQISCTNPANGSSHATEENLATLSMLYSPNGELKGDPNIYNMELSFPDSELKAFERAGDLPAPNTKLTAYDLPAAEKVKISLKLYKDKINPALQTHSCSSKETISLTRLETTSTELSCLPVGNIDSKPVSIFIKVAKIEATITEDLDSLALSRDWSTPAMFGRISNTGDRITLKQDPAGNMTVHVAGDLSYYAKGNGESLLQKLVDGEEVELKATGGKKYNSNSSRANIFLVEDPMMIDESGLLIASLSINIESRDNSVNVSASLYEETYGHELTFVSYNVENIFDQVDVERNSHYGDYRISPNSRNQSSNYGEQVKFNGKFMSFTDVKALGIKKTLLAIDPLGPEIIALQEVESHRALANVFDKLKELGYVSMQFTDWGDMTPNAIGAGIISKYPIKSFELVGEESSEVREPLRRTEKVVLDIYGKELVVFNNHWKSKGSPESKRLAQARMLQAHINQMLLANPKTDYLIVGDLNSDYNENVIIEDGHNDTHGITGINDEIGSQGDELGVATKSLHKTYNLHYELDRSLRRTAYHNGFGWSSFDHIILNNGLYDSRGITYVDNSFQIAGFNQPQFSHLFKNNGTTNRWNSQRNNTYSHHRTGGYSDHLPIFARFHIRRVQNDAPIRLFRPGVPDATDNAASR